MFNHQPRVLFLLLLLTIITFPLLTSAQTTNQSLIDSLYQQVLQLKAKLTASFSNGTQLATVSGSVASVTEIKLLGSDTVYDDLFGISVSISGDTAIVGASGHDAMGTNSGAAYIFH